MLRDIRATFADDDYGYDAWLGTHPAGFVLDCDRNPKVGDFVLHRAACSAVSGPPVQGTTWTGGANLKVCADSIAELEAWAGTTGGGSPQHCPSCVP